MITETDFPTELQVEITVEGMDVIYDATIKEYSGKSCVLYLSEAFSNMAEVHEWHREMGYDLARNEFRIWHDGHATIDLVPIDSGWD